MMKSRLERCPHFGVKPFMVNQNVSSESTKVLIDKLITLFHSDQFQEVILFGQDLIKHHPDVPILYEVMAAANLMLGNAEETIEIYGKLLLLNPKHAEAYNNLGKIFYDKGDFSTAQANYQRAVEIEPEFADAHYNLGNSHRRTGDLRKAITSYEKSLEIAPDDAEVLNKCGEAFNEYGNFEHAIGYYNQALRINPNIVNIQSNLATATGLKIKVDKLINQHAEEAELELDSKEVLNFCGRVLQREGFHDAAIDCFEKAIQKNIKYWEAYKNLGSSLSEKGEYSKAITNFRKAIEIIPNDAEVYTKLGITLRQARDFGSSIKNFDKAIMLQPNYIEAYANKSAALDQQGKFDAAVDCCGQALSIKRKIQIDEVKNTYKINFQYLSVSGLVDQTFYSFESNAKNEEKAVKMLKDLLNGGLQIRIDRVFDLTPKPPPPTLLIRLQEQYKNKNKLQTSILIFGGIMVILAGLSKAFVRMFN